LDLPSSFKGASDKVDPEKERKAVLEYQRFRMKKNATKSRTQDSTGLAKQMSVLGIKGRKTGYVVSHQISKDEDDMENVDEFFDTSDEEGESEKSKRNKREEKKQENHSEASSPKSKQTSTTSSSSSKSKTPSRSSKKTKESEIITPPATELHETAEALSTPLSTGAKKSKGKQSPKGKGASPNVEPEHHEYNDITPTTLEFGGDVDVSEGEVVDKSGNVEAGSSDMEIEMGPPASKPSKKVPKKTQNQVTSSSSPTKKGAQKEKNKKPKEKKEKKRKPKEVTEYSQELAARKRYKPVPYWENQIVNYTPDAKRRCAKDDEFL